MESEVQWVYDRLRLYSLMQEHPLWSPESYAEVLGRSSKWARKWQARFMSSKNKNLSMFLSHSRAPKNRPRQTSKEVKLIIGNLRQELSEKYHRNAGARLILYELNKYEQLGDLQKAGHFVPRASSTINAILYEMGYIQRSKPRERIPVELPPPNEEWEMDFGEIRIDENTILEFFLVVDRGTSRVIYLEGSRGYSAETALEAVARLFVINGLPKRLRLDRDPRFVGSWTGDSYPSALVRFLRVMGVQEVICPPRRPDLKPFVERCVKTVKEEWLARFSLNNYATAIEILPEFLHYHNGERVHFGYACQGNIPDEFFSSLDPLPRIPETVDPDAWLMADNKRVFRRRITSNGTIQIDKHVYYIDGSKAKTQVLVYLDAHRKQFHVFQDNTMITSLDIVGLRHKTMDFQDYLAEMKLEARSIERHRWLTWYRAGEIPW